MGAGAIHGHQDSNLPSTSSPQRSSHSNTSRHQDCSRSSYSSSSAHVSYNSKHTMKMSCEMCSSNFNFFKRKKFCQECHRFFCSTCLPKPPSSSPAGRQCRKCLLLISGNFTRDDLQDWKVKDIRCFLDVHKVSTKGCREKHDLVELVLSQFCKERRDSLEHQAEHDLLVQEMAARLTLDNARNQVHSTTVEGGSEATGVTSNMNREEPFLSSSTRSGTNNSESRSDRNRNEEDADSTGFGAMNSQEFRDFLQSQVEEILNSEFAQQEAERARQSNTPSHSAPTRCRLEEVQTLEDIDLLNVRQLKELLVNNFVNFKGCCEKPELIQRVKRLWNDHQENKIKAERIHKADEDAGTTSPDAIEKDNINDIQKDNLKDIHATPSATDSSKDSIPIPVSAMSEDHLSPPGAASSPSPSASPSKKVPITTEEPQDSLCRVCMDALTNCILLECGHMVTCTTCGKQLAECPICRQYISRVVRVFRS